MFFVGATGQILTLILTVCLPFVLLVSGNQKIEVEPSATNFTVNQNVQELTFSESTTFSFSAELTTDKSDHFVFKFNNFPEIKQVPIDNYRVNWKSVYSTSSGNKAPPVILYYCC
jgi:hypothetical protein